MEKMEFILETHIISYLSKSDNGVLMALIPESDYGTDEAKQEHFTGKTFNEAIEQAYQFLIR